MLQRQREKAVAVSKLRIAVMATTAALAWGLTDAASGEQEYDHTFLSDYSKLQARPLPNNAGTDLLYVAPATFERLGKYDAIMVDEPEILISSTSDYLGAKPTDLQAVATFVRSDIIAAMKAGGYGVVDTVGPSVLYLRIAVTDLSLKKKKRVLLSYTPVGAILHVGVNAFQDMMQKYDIMGATIQGQMTDSSSNEVLAEFVFLRGNNGGRMEFKQLDAGVKNFASRLRCRLDNAHVPTEQQIDCLDRAARQARETKKKAAP